MIEGLINPFIKGTMLIARIREYARGELKKLAIC
jgi:hypothetical protein